MNLNADFSVRAAVHAARMAWTPSPMTGVERRMLDRIGEEVARATSIVRYAPASHFSPHTHGGGEEFLVLSGVFSDEHGDYAAGSYIRNPPTSRHTPHSGPGCVIFVKLWQFDLADRTEVRLDANHLAYGEVPDQPGVAVASLFKDTREEVRLERWAPRAEIARALPGGMEVLALDGAFQEGGEWFEAQSWLRLPAGATLRATVGPEGAKVWCKTGHLAEDSMKRPLAI